VGRKACRSGQRCEIGSLAEAIDCTVHHSDPTLKQIAERIGKTEGYLRASSSQYDDSHKFQAELIVPITVATGNFAILDYMERQVGRVALTVPDGLGRGDVFERTADLMRELGEAIEEIRRTLTDGRVEAAEAERVKKEIHDIQRAAAALQACVIAQLGAPGAELNVAPQRF
jgi:hypothetical protein